MEIILVLAIFLILAVASLSYTADNLGTQNLKTAGLGVTSSLSEARNSALQGFHDSAHGVYFDTNNSQYVLFSGNNYATRDAGYDYVQYWSSSLSVTPSTPFEVVFTKLTGTTTAQTIIFSANNQQEVIQVNSEGIIE